MVEQLVYDLVIRLYRIGIGLTYTFNPKAKKWVKGRKNWKQGIAEWARADQRPTIWIHAASLGEFEQGRPVIEELYASKKSHKILVTFFSPSGYEIRSDFEKADRVSYLTLDTRHNARVFVNTVNPAMAIFIKYEFWFNHLKELKKKETPTLLISGRLHNKQSFFKPWGRYFREGLNAFDHFFVQNEESRQLLEQIGFVNCTVNGDTRFDRVIALKEEEREFDQIRKFCEDSPCLMLGSSWPGDELLVQEFLHRHSQRDFKLVIAPHEIDDKRISEFIKNSQVPVIRFSDIEERRGDERVLIIDSIGILSYLYRYSSVVMIGGGFGAGIHNVLEAAVFSKPIVFGPRYQMFKEAVDLVENGAAFSVETQDELDAVLLDLLFDKPDLHDFAGQMAWRYCEANKGAKHKVIDYVDSKLISP